LQFEEAIVELIGVITDRPTDFVLTEHEINLVAQARELCAVTDYLCEICLRAKFGIDLPRIFRSWIWSAPQRLSATRTVVDQCGRMSLDGAARHDSRL
jgi:hypothetical protein